MENHEQLDNLIKTLLQTDETPSIYLNQVLKTKVREHSVKKVSLWYLPMTANIILFICLNLLAQIFISSFIVLAIFAIISIYLCSLIIFFTFVGIKWFNFKNITSIYLQGGV